MKLFFLILATLFIYKMKSQVVCSEFELIQELKDDIADNGQLDCLRESFGAEGETEQQKHKRIAAEWDGDCSFEAENSEADWLSQLQKNYGLSKGLVDVEGNPVPKDFDDQADMCEIIRALLVSGKFNGIKDDISNLTPDFVNEIDCPGPEGQTEVCAATSGSFAEKEKWNIVLDGQSLKFSGKPVFKTVPEE